MSELDALMCTRAVEVPLGPDDDTFGTPRPTCVDRVYHRDGNYWVLWMTDPPECSMNIRVTRDEWQFGPDTRRRIFEWEAA